MVPTFVGRHVVHIVVCITILLYLLLVVFMSNTHKFQDDNVFKKAV